MKTEFSCVGEKQIKMNQDASSVNKSNSQVLHLVHQYFMTGTVNSAKNGTLIENYLFLPVLCRSFADVLSFQIK